MFRRGLAAEICLVSVAYVAAAEVMLPPGKERLTLNLEHESRDSGPPPKTNTSSPISANVNVNVWIYPGTPKS